MIPLILGSVTVAAVGYGIAKLLEEDEEPCVFNETEFADDMVKEMQAGEVALTALSLQKDLIYKTQLKPFFKDLSTLKNAKFKAPKRKKLSSHTETINNDLLSYEKLERLEEFMELLSDITQRFDDFHKEFQKLLAISTDYEQYEKDEREMLESSLKLSKLITKMCHITILDEENHLTFEAIKSMHKAKKYLLTKELPVSDNKPMFEVILDVSHKSH